jgi:hypothetical protein
MTMGPQLSDLDEQLLRQVHPSWIQAGKPTSQAFRPTAKDDGLLSVSRGSKTTAAAAFDLHTRVKGLQSVGVWGILVSHCADARLDVHEDPLTEPFLDPAHAVIDFTGLNDKEVRAKSQLLKAMAEPIFVQKAEDSP